LGAHEKGIGEVGVIEGVQINPLKIIADERGTVRHMLKASDDAFVGFGEIYFSTIKPNAVKAWHLHKRMRLAYACVVGQIAVGLVDGRDGSKTKGDQMVVYLPSPEVDPEGYVLLVIPPGVWNGFRVPENIDREAIVANCTDIEHDPAEIVRVPPMYFPFDFSWGKYDVAG